MSAGGGEAQSRAPAELRWRQWVLTTLAIFAAAFVLFAGFVALVDPYDTGRFLSVLPHGVNDEAPRTANASRGRDPRFNAAIIGNSYSQLLDPARLSASTGLSFVQMTVPGTGPREHVTLLKWFLQNHPNARAVALGLDETWCVTDPALPLYNPFPIWLYGNGAEFYARHLSSRSVEMGLRRVRLALGKAAPSDPAGHWDYEQGRVWNYRPELSDAQFIDMSPRMN